MYNPTIYKKKKKKRRQPTAKIWYSVCDASSGDATGRGEAVCTGFPGKEVHRRAGHPHREHLKAQTDSPALWWREKKTKRSLLLIPPTAKRKRKACLLRAVAS